MSLLALALLVGVQTAEASASPASLDCAYAARATGEMQTFPGCATRDPQGRIRLAPHHRARLGYDAHGLAGIFVEGWYYVTRDGRSAAVMAFDNGPDPFAQGLARSPRGGRIGFIDRGLRLVIPAEFDGAFPFDHGLAAVCVGCQTAPDREHETYVGGNWGCIDRRGRFVTPLHAAAGYVPCQPER